MHLLGSDNQIKKFKSVEDILFSYYEKVIKYQKNKKKYNLKRIK